MLVDDDQPLLGFAQQIGAPELADHVQARKPSLLPQVRLAGGFPIGIQFG